MTEQEEKEILEKAERIKKEKAKEHKKEYNKQYVKNKTVSKVIRFSIDNDRDIIDHLNSIDKQFTNYIKELIRKDMKNHE